MRLKIIACKVLQREIAHIASSCENYIDMTFMRQSLHNDPVALQKAMQEEIDKIESGEDLHTTDTYVGDFDAVLIGYGLCSNGILNLTSKKYKLIVPRAHDCMTLYLGSKERYKEYFNATPGIYWYNAGWIENAALPEKYPREKLLLEYTEIYGEENAEYLVEMEYKWMENYKSLTYINMPFLKRDELKDFSRNAAVKYGWSFDEMDGDMSLLSDMLNGNWDNERFLIVLPGEKVLVSYDDRIVISGKQD